MPRMPMDITLEGASAADLDELVALRIEAMRESLERIGRFDPVRARERFILGFSPENTQHIVAASRRVGFIVTKLQEGHLLLDHLYIKPRHQNLGIGASVLQAVFKKAASLALPIRVGALKESASNRFYERHGFQLVEQSEFDNYYIRREPQEATRHE